jgi:hypothetical protein
MIRYIGNCSSVIDWNKVITELESCENPGYGPTHKEGDPIPRLSEVTDLWKKAGYKTKSQGGSTHWDMFFPGIHYDKSIESKFVEYFEIEILEGSWISRIWPGYFAPMHWDVHDEEKTLLARPDIPRWHCHIGKPEFGHIFIAGDELFYNKNQGDTFEWSSRRLWHAGNNAGLVPKYLFNIY